MVVTVWTEWVALSSGSRRPQHQLEVIKGATQLFVELNCTVLWKTVGIITVRAVQTTWFGLERECNSSEHLYGQFKTCRKSGSDHSDLHCIEKLHQASPFPLLPMKCFLDNDI